MGLKSIEAFLAAIIFSVLSCHAEALFFINCVNELFSAAFILTGLYWFIKYDSDKYTVAIIFTFLLALLSRESAICYIPLLLLVKLKAPARSRNNTALILIIPVLLYIAFRIFAEINYGETGARLSFEQLDLNPAKIIYRLFHYFTNMILPVKFLFEFIGFDSLEVLVNAFKRPSENLTVFLGLSIMVSLIFGTLIYFFVRILKKDIIFPLLFIFFSLAIYLFSLNTAERFLYLPSAGLCILLAMIFSKINNRKIAVILISLFIIIHSTSLIFRSYRHKQAAVYSREVIKDLSEKTSQVSAGSAILFENIPPKKFGIFFLSPYNFQSNWDYNYPDKKLKLLFSQTLSSNVLDSIDAVYRFEDAKSSFERIK